MDDDRALYAVDNFFNTSNLEVSDNLLQIRLDWEKDFIKHYVVCSDSTSCKECAELINEKPALNKQINRALKHLINTKPLFFSSEKLIIKLGAAAIVFFLLPALFIAGSTIASLLSAISKMFFFFFSALILSTTFLLGDDGKIGKIFDKCLERVFCFKDFRDAIQNSVDNFGEHIETVVIGLGLAIVGLCLYQVYEKIRLAKYKKIAQVFE